METCEKMNEKQKEIIKELKKAAEKLGHSPTRRDMPQLAWKCYNHFASFNKAKQIANLEIRNVRITKFPKRAFIIDKDLARIASYLTFDGHIYKNLKGMFYSSKNIKDIKDFEKIILQKFKIKGKIKLNSAGSHHQTHKFYVFNKIIATKLLNKGVPKGDKSTQAFYVPHWIKNNKEFSREYLKIVYLCEGSMKENRKHPRIQINTGKCEELLSSGIKFMNELRQMLSKFGIRTTECSVYGTRVRKRDNKVCRDIRFRILTSDSDKFIKEIGWFK